MHGSCTCVPNALRHGMPPGAVLTACSVGGARALRVPLCASCGSVRNRLGTHSGHQLQALVRGMYSGHRRIHPVRALRARSGDETAHRRSKSYDHVQTTLCAAKKQRSSLAGSIVAHVWPVRPNLALFGRGWKSVRPIPGSVWFHKSRPASTNIGFDQL